MGRVRRWEIRLARCEASPVQTRPTHPGALSCLWQRLVTLLLAPLVQNALPDAVDGLLELRSRCGANLVQIRFGRAAHDQEVLFRHSAYDRIAVEQLGRLTDRSNPGPSCASFVDIEQTASRT